MSTRFPLRLLYTMAVVLAVLAMLFLMLIVTLKISGLLLSEPDKEPRAETTTVITNAKAGGAEREPDCNGDLGMYRATKGLKGRVAYTCKGDAYLMTLATGDVARLSHGARFVRQLAWSPDGSRVAHDVYGEGAIELTTLGRDSSRRLDIRSQAGDLDWSPDGESIAFLDNTGFDGKGGLAVIDTDGTGLKTIVNESQDLFGGPIVGLDWSPDGEKILFQSTVASGGGVGLYTIKPDGTELAQIFGNRVVREILDTSLLYWEDPTYSPDGRWIAFVNNSTSHEDPDRRSQLFVMDAHGMNLRRVTSEPGEKFLASWSTPGGSGARRPPERLCSPACIPPASCLPLAADSSRASTRCQEGRLRRSFARRIVRTAHSRSSPTAGDSGKRATTASTPRAAERCA